MLLVVLLGLVLAACVPAPADTAADPASLRATAQAYSRMAEAYNSQAAQEEANRMATEQAYREQVTQTAQAYQATAQYLSIEATRQAFQATATANAISLSLQFHQATATIQTLDRKAQEEQRSAEIARRREEAQSLLEVVLVFLVFATLIGLLIVFLYRLLDTYIRRQETRSALFYSPIGVLVVQREGVPPVRVNVIRPELGDGQERALEEGTDENESEVAWIPQWEGERLIGYVRADWRKPREDPRQRLAMRLLRESIRRVGGEADYIPGWRELEWPAESWSRAVALLRPYVNAVPGRGGGTFLVGEYRTLAELYTALGSGRIALAPSPAPADAA